MAIRAFILIENSVGRSNDVVAALRGTKGVTSADRVTGPYDIIAVIEAPDLKAVGDIVTNRVHRVPGVVRTVTSLAVPLA